MHAGDISPHFETFTITQLAGGGMVANDLNLPSWFLKRCHHRQITQCTLETKTHRLPYLNITYY